MTEDTANESQDSAKQTDAAACGNALAMKPWQAVVAAVLAGLIAWGIVEAIMPVYQMPQELLDLAGAARAGRLEEMSEASADANAKNVTLSLVISGVAFALLLTVTELVSRGSPSRAIWGAPLAGIIAGGIGIGAGMAGAHLAEAVSLQDPTDRSISPLMKSLIVQCTMWGVVGLGVGLGIGLPTFRPRLMLTCLIGCVVGGLLGGVAFLVLAAVVTAAGISDISTEQLMPEPGIGRLFWIAISGALIGMTVAGLGKAKSKK
jgi:hypothetical protein